MPKRYSFTALGYTLAPLAVTAALLLRELLWPLVGNDAPFLLLWPAVMASAWYAGLGPGLLATLLAAAAANYYVIEPVHTFAIQTPTELVVLALFVALGSCTSLLVEGLHRARRRAEWQAAALAEQREWLDATLAGVGEGILATDRAGRVTLLNPAAERLLGWPRVEALGRPHGAVLRLVSARPPKAVADPLAQVLGGAPVARVEAHALLLTRDGPARIVEGTAATLADGRGAVLVFRDVTEGRRGEEAVAQLAAVAESSEDAIVVRTLTGVVTSWNPAAERLYGYAAGEMVGERVDRIVPAAHADELLEAMDRLRRGERVPPFATMRLRKNGTLVDVWVSVGPVQDAAGKLIGAVVIARPAGAASLTTSAG